MAAVDEAVVEAGRRGAAVVLAAAVAVALLPAAPASAATRTWTGAVNTAWSHAENWAPVGAPVTGDHVVLTDAGAAPASYDLGAGVQLGSVTFQSPGTYTVSGGGASLNLASGGSITSNSSATLLLPLTLAGPATLQTSALNSLTVAAIGGTGPLTLVNDGISIQLNAASTYSGATTIEGSGVVRATVNGAIPTGSALTLDAVLELDQSSTVASLAGSGTVRPRTGPVTLTVGGDGTSTTFAGALADGGQFGNFGMSLTKTGAGTLTLSGTSTNGNGVTTVAQGELLVTGTLPSEVTVQDGATLSGTGTTGDVTVASGGIVAPGTSVGTLTTGDLTLSAASVLDFELAAPGIGDLVDVEGDLVLDGMLDLTDLEGFGVGTYTLLTYSGSLTDHGLAVSGLPAGLAATVRTTTPGQVDLVVAVPSTPQPTPTPSPTPVVPLFLVERMAQAGETVSTLPPGAVLSEEAPAAVAVTTPNAGLVRIEIVLGMPDPAPAGFVVLPLSILATAPPATPADPLVVAFTLHPSLLDGQDAPAVVPLRDGVAVPDCDEPAGTAAEPDPCVAGRDVGDDGVLTMIVRTSAASTWTFGAPEPAPPPSLDVGCPPARFDDLPHGNPHAEAVDCAALLGVALGFPDGTYRPGDPVRRDQMASFVARTLAAAGLGLPPAAHGFADLDGNPHADAVGRLAAAGVTHGTSATTYSPDQTVTRGQMAAFLVRALDLAGVAVPAGGTGSFPDAAGNPHADAIDAAFELGLASGVTPTRFAPADPVRRDQMATFLIRLHQRL